VASPQRSYLSAVDGHQHFWNLERNSLPWLRPEHTPIARTFEPDELEPLLRAQGITQTILVQSADHDADTDFLFELAGRYEWIAAVVPWVPLAAPERAQTRLDELADRPKLRGIRHLIHDEPDRHWVLRAPVLESLALLEERGLVLELPAVYPNHLGDVPELARTFPRLQLVVDHLGKPPIGSDLGAWAEQLRGAASYPNVSAKISGLNTAIAHANWRARDLVPALEVALDAFGPDRLLCGSDWPVSLLNVDYHRVWTETLRALQEVAPDHLDALLAGTAGRLYRLPDSPHGSH
jgi:L-fuconolactonase